MNLEPAEAVLAGTMLLAGPSTWTQEIFLASKSFEIIVVPQYPPRTDSRNPFGYHNLLAGLCMHNSEPADTEGWLYM